MLTRYIDHDMSALGGVLNLNFLANHGIIMQGYRVH